MGPGLLALFLCVGCAPEAPPKGEDLLVVLNKAAHSATVIDLGSGQTKGTLVTGVAPHEAAGDSAEGLVVACNYGTQENAGFSLSVLDVKRMRVSRTIPLGRFRRPHGIQFFRDGARVAVTTEDSETVLVVNIETGRIEKAIPTAQRTSHHLVLSPDEKRAYVVNIRSGTVSVLDIEESRLVDTLAIGNGAEGLDVSPDGSELWVTNRLKDELAIVDTESLKVEERVPCPGSPIRLRFTPNGSEVVVSNSKSGDLSVFSARDRHEIQRISLALTPEEKEGRFGKVELSPVPVGIVMDPAAQRAYVASSNADLVTAIDTAKWSIVTRFPTGREPDGMALIHLAPPQTASSPQNDDRDSDDRETR